MVKFSTIFLVSIPSLYAEEDQSLQFQLGDEVSIYSNKAYRKRNGELFEAVGNVVILHKKETLYGQSASFDMKSGVFMIEGNVRYITEDMTLYGTMLEYQMKNRYIKMKNARIVSEDFSIVASQIERLSENHYIAEEAEYSTCRNCPESWSIYGEKIDLTIGDYVRIKNGLIKLNAIDVMIIPYIVLPVKKSRESGLLFPRLSSRFSEGVAFEQPWYWAISGNKDLTLSPTFWAARGYGADIEYRHIFAEQRWLTFNSRMLNDSIYLPGKLDSEQSGQNRFRHFSEFETHQQLSNKWNSHFHFTEVRDLDIVQDFSMYAEPRVRGSDVGGTGFLEYRADYFTFDIESEFNRNLLSNNADKFDSNYVQVLPEFNFSVMPQYLVKSKADWAHHVAVGLDSKYSNFRQNVFDESAGPIRNAKRLVLNPYVDLNYFTLGAFNLKTRYMHDYQHYEFGELQDENFQKFSNIMTTTFSFSVDKVYGLAYREKVPIDKLSQDDIKKYRETEVEEKVVETNNQTVGILPSFEESFKDDFVIVNKNAFKHTQEFKFIHHYIFDESVQGNSTFKDQIRTSNTGWFDYTDAIRSRENELGSNNTRMMVPPDNTFEIQWNNALVKKTPGILTNLKDENFLHDNYLYKKVGFFNLSQGLKLSEDENNTDEDFSDKLTRLYINTGFNFDDWALELEDYYFHDTSDNILSTTFHKYFDMFQLYLKYNVNSFSQSNLKTLTFGTLIKPVDVLRLSFAQEFDLRADKNTKSIYDIDYIPNNNCYFFNLNYMKTLFNDRLSFNIVFNFGDNNFKSAQKGLNIDNKI